MKNTRFSSIVAYTSDIVNIYLIQVQMKQGKKHEICFPPIAHSSFSLSEQKITVFNFGSSSVCWKFGFIGVVVVVIVLWLWFDE